MTTISIPFILSLGVFVWLLTYFLTYCLVFSLQVARSSFGSVVDSYLPPPTFRSL